MSSTLILPAHTELKALNDKIDILKDFTAVSAGEKLHKITKRIFFDLTFDIFHKNVTPAFLYGFFNENEPILSQNDIGNSQLLVLRNYPFRSNRVDLLVKQKIIDMYTAVLAEFHHAKTIYLPNLVSRNTMGIVQNPVITTIHSIRQGLQEPSRFKKTSRFFVIYDMDLMGFLMKQEEVKSDILVEGIELTLEEVSCKASQITGQTFAPFDSSNVVQYEFPQGAAASVSAVNYELEDMIVDITSYLF